MKKIYTIAALCLILCSQAKTEPIDTTVAKAVAVNFYNANSAKNITIINLAYTEYTTEGVAAFYVFNINKNDGWVMISADDAAIPILGYNIVGNFSETKMSPQLKAFKNAYKEQIRFIRIRKLKAQNKEADLWNNYRKYDSGNSGARVLGTPGFGGTAPYTPSNGYLCQTTWNQSPGYNKFCPGVSSGYNVPTGCVATAMAQILCYHKYPNQITGTNSYFEVVSGVGTFNLSLSNTSYDWNSISSSQNSSNDDIANLMLDCGISVHMDYEIGVSGASTLGSGYSAENAFKTFFNYNASTVQGKQRLDYNSADWISLLKKEINNKRPILYRASDANGQGGHAWVCDGYDAMNYFHMNWGWGNEDNGFYSIEYLNSLIPANTNGLSAFNFVNDQAALIGIEPSSGTCPIPSNDNSCNATSITINGSSVNGTICGANGDPTFTSYPGVKDVFYSIQPNTSNITVTVSPASGSSFYPSFQLLSSTSCSSLSAVNTTSVTSNGAGQSATKTFQIVSGDTYYIRVWDNGSSNGNFIISVIGTSCIAPGRPYSLSPGITSTTPVIGQTITTTTPNLTWALPSGATVYKVNISKYPYGSNNIIYTSGSLTSGSVIVPSGYLQNGYSYRWDVTAYASAGSSCYTISSDCYFTVNTGTLCATPTTQSSNIYFTGAGSNSATVNWTVGSGERHIVKINTTSNFNNINNGITPAIPNTTYSGSGEQVVYDGSGSYVSVYGLSPNTSYYFKLYDANCSGTMSMYNNNTATNNPNYFTTTSGTLTCTAPTVAASNVSFTSVGTNSMTINWTNGNGSKRIVKMNTYYGFTQPTDGTDPSFNSYWNNAGEQIVYNGTGNSITVSGLNANTQYCFKIFEANCSGNGIVYAANTNNNGGCQYTQQTCVLPTTIPIPTTGAPSCTQLSPYAFGYNSSGYNLYWSDNYGSAYYDIEIYEYPYNSNNKVYSQNCINSHNTIVPTSYLQPGKLYCWRVRMSVNDCNCYGNWSQMYYFGITPQMSIDNDIVACNGKGITLTTPSVNVQSPGSVQYLWYHWQYNNGVRSDVYMGSGSSFYVDAEHSGYVFVKLVYSGSTICPGNDTTIMSNVHYVKIGTTPSAPTLVSSSPVCEGNMLTLTATPPDNANSYLYYWSGPSGFSSSNNSININAVNSSNAGTYSCYLVGSYLSADAPGCPGATATTNVVVNPAPVASYTYSVSGNSVTFTNTTTNATTYNWNFGDGQTSTVQNPVHTFTANGTFTVCLAANNYNGCNASTYCQSITLGGSTTVKTVPTFIKLFTEKDNAHLQWNASDFIQSSVDSSFICFGASYNFSTTNRTIRFFKIDKAGKTVWAREILSTLYQYPGTIIQSKNGYLLSFVNGNVDANVMEIDENGNTLWSKQIQNTGSIYSMLKVTDGYIFKTQVNNGMDIFKIDFSGNLIWKKQWIFNIYTNTWGNNSTGISTSRMLQDSNGNFYIIGGFYDGQASNFWQAWDGMISKYDAAGNHLWTKTYATPVHDDFVSTLIDNNSDILFVNYSVDNSNISTYQFGKISSTGALLTAKQLQSNSGWIQLVNTKPDNTLNCLLGNSTLRSFVNLSSDLAIINSQKGINFNTYSFKPTLDGRFAGISQYLVNSTNNDYGYSFEKYSFTDVSCRDSVAPQITFSPTTMSFGSLTPTAGASTITVASLTISTGIITLSDSNLCTTCNLTANITPSGSTIFCMGNNVSLSANAGMISYLWSNGATTPSITVTTSGSYTVTVTDSYGCSATSDPVSVTVNPLPATPLIIWNSPLLSTTSGMAFYQWYLNGNAISGTSNNTCTPTTSGLYKVEVGNSSGCKAMSAGYNLVFTAVNDVTVNGILYSLYPNPTTKEATLKLSSMPLSKTTLTVVNSYGQKVLSRIITNQTETIAVDHLPQGYYLIMVESKNHSGILKLIVLR